MREMRERAEQQGWSLGRTFEMGGGDLRLEFGRNSQNLTATIMPDDVAGRCPAPSASLYEARRCDSVHID